VISPEAIINNRRIKKMYNMEVERRKLEEMPYDMRFDGELCHATGYEVRDEYGFWWNEYINSEGELYYGK
jgi:hypothetical protein